jgi:hypothetical protein
MPTSNLSIKAESIGPVKTAKDASYDILFFFLDKFEFDASSQSICEAQEFIESKINELKHKANT